MGVLASLPDLHAGLRPPFGARTIVQPTPAIRYPTGWEAITKVMSVFGPVLYNPTKLASWNCKMQLLTHCRIGERGWRGALIVIAICSLTLSVATRFWAPFTSQSHIVKSVDRQLSADPKRQHLDRDAARWLAPGASFSMHRACFDRKSSRSCRTSASQARFQRQPVQSAPSVVCIPSLIFWQRNSVVGSDPVAVMRRLLAALPAFWRRG